MRCRCRVESWAKYWWVMRVVVRVFCECRFLNRGKVRFRGVWMRFRKKLASFFMFLNLFIKL